ncbi:MAG: hypothetical protein JWL86_1349 [Rhizobium sp.]|nr:hypothetical protein [Rhizobium sp.]
MTKLPLKDMRIVTLQDGLGRIAMRNRIGNYFKGLSGRLSASAIVLLSLSGAASADATSITLGYGLAADFIPAFVAKEEGFFQKNGLDVTLTSFPNTSVIVPTIISGSVQIGASTPPNLVLAAQGGLDIVDISGAARLTKSDPRTNLLTRAGFSVKTASDLSGKKVGVPGINSILDMFFRKWLLNNGVALNKVIVVEAPFARMGDLLKSGQIDAAVAIEPLLGRIVGSGSASPSVDFLSEVDPDVLGALWASTRAWADANPKTVLAFRQSLAQSLDLIKSDPEKARAIENKYLHFNGRTFPTFSLETKVEDFTSVIKVATDLGLLTEKVDAKTLIWAPK